MRKSSLILLAITVLVVGGMIALFMIFNKSAPITNGQDGGSGQIVRSTSHRLGDGAVTVVEFGDYECPACGAAYPILKQIIANYKTKISFVFRNFPLTSIHPNATIGAEAAEAAGLQNKFWEMHDMLYEHQNDWGSSPEAESLFESYARVLGLDVNKFKTDESSSQISNIIAADVADGNALGINATPTIYINGQAQSSYDYNTLKAAIDKALK